MKNILTIGTDCSGIDTPVLALRNLGIAFKHMFSCEKDKYCRKTIEKNFFPKYHYVDITDRNISEIPYVDLYVCGFPCQPFSNAGKRKGFSDERGNIFWYCLEYIEFHAPKFFLLENVKGILWHDKGKTWETIKTSLENLEKYDFYWKVLNTRNFGIPQNRERVYMIGIRKDQKIQFEWPKPIKMHKIINYIDNSTNHTDEIRADVIKSQMLDKIPKDAVFVDFSFKKHHYPNSNKYSPTIAADSRLWCVPKKRYATQKERQKLQGLNQIIFPDIPQKQIFKQIGNSMSANVIILILKNLL